MATISLDGEDGGTPLSGAPEVTHSSREGAKPPAENGAEKKDSKESLADLVKRGQRESKGFKERWWDFCDKYGKGFYDPHRHEQRLLQDFMRLEEKRANGSYSSSSSRSASSRSRSRRRRRRHGRRDRRRHHHRRRKRRRRTRSRRRSPTSRSSGSESYSSSKRSKDEESPKKSDEKEAEAKVKAADKDLEQAKHVIKSAIAEEEKRLKAQADEEIAAVQAEVDQEVAAQIKQVEEKLSVDKASRMTEAKERLDQALAQPWKLLANHTFQTMRLPDSIH